MILTRWIPAPSLAALALAVASPAFAQVGEVVQATPSAAAVDSLNRNLALLSRNPQDVTALLGAGQAALDLGDIQAANGFFARANMVNPQLGKAKLGLAVVQIALKQPSAAASNFDAAAALGEQAQGHLADRGLAYDLTGQQEKAQRDYQAALRANPSDDVARLRYAVSLGISGKVTDADRQLESALAGGDREAWRMRAFVYAMNGRIDEARKVTQSVMPKGLADALDPYMQRLPLLASEQKAAAAYYGEFPTDMLKLAAPAPVKERDVQVATSNQNNRRDRRSRASDNRPSRETARAETGRAATTPAPAAARPELTPPAAPVATPTPAPSEVKLAANDSAPRSAPAATPRPTTTALPPSAPARTTATPTASAPVRTAATPATTTPAPVASRPVQGPAISSAQPAPAAPRPSTPAPGSNSAAQPATSTRSFGDLISTLEVPEAERQQTATAADLTAVSRIQEQRRKAAEAAAAKAKAQAEAKAKADAAKKAEAERKAKLAANPSRNWVQIATGKDVDALAFDLRRMRRTYADAIGDLTGWTAEWGATRRLLVGPFKTPEEARKVVTQITKSGGDAFLWQSEAGEEVAKIGAK